MVAFPLVIYGWAGGFVAGSKHVSVSPLGGALSEHSINSLSEN